MQDALQVLKQDHSAVRAREDSLLKEIASKDERMREISLQLEAAHNSHEDTKKDLELRNERCANPTSRMQDPAAYLSQ